MKTAAKDKAPTAAQNAPRAPQTLMRSADSVESDDLLLGVVALADDAEVFHVEAGRAQLFHRRFRRIMVREDGDHCVCHFHLMLAF